MPNPRDVFYRKMAGRGGWAHLDLADALKVMDLADALKEKTFHIATIKWYTMPKISGVVEQVGFFFNFGFVIHAYGVLD